MNNTFRTFFESTYKYKNPQALNFLLFDFYMLTYLNHVVTKDHHRINEDEIDLIQDAYKTNINVLTKHMLDGVYYGIVREMRHVRSRARWRKAAPAPLNKIIDNFYKILRNVEIKVNLDNGSTFTKLVIKRLNDLKIPRTDVVNLGEFIFSNYMWEEDYGDEPWANICRAWKKLYYSKSYKDRAIWIDHLYDLQHNNGSVLDKMKNYDNWLSHALDFKRDIHNFKDIIPYISPKLRKHSLRILQKIGHIPPSPPRRTSSFIDAQRASYHDFLIKRGNVPTKREADIPGNVTVDMFKATRNSDVFITMRDTVFTCIDLIVSKRIVGPSNKVLSEKLGNNIKQKINNSYNEIIMTIIIDVSRFSFVINGFELYSTNPLFQEILKRHKLLNLPSTSISQSHVYDSGFNSIYARYTYSDINDMAGKIKRGYEQFIKGLEDTKAHLKYLANEEF